MKKNHKYIITNERKGQIIFVVFILLAIVIGLIWNELERDERERIEPDIIYQMVNGSINWEQSFHYGSWGENNAGA